MYFQKNKDFDRILLLRDDGKINLVIKYPWYNSYIHLILKKKPYSKEEVSIKF